MKQFTTLIKNQFNYTAGTYRSDEGGEYNDRELLRNLKDLVRGPNDDFGRPDR